MESLPIYEFVVIHSARNIHISPYGKEVGKMSGRIKLRRYLGLGYDLLFLRQGRLACALIVIELVSAIQIYLTSTTSPMMLQTFGAVGQAGVVTSLTSAALFFGMPFGGFLVSRFSINKLLMVMTLMQVVLSLLSAFSLNLVMYISSRMAQNISSGLTATVVVGAVAVGLDKKWRAISLAAIAGVWVIASMLGPAYAGWVTSVMGWRWALVLYLPLIVVARFIVAANIDDNYMKQKSADKLPLKEALLLSVGMTLAGGVIVLPRAQWLFTMVGGILCVYAARGILMRLPKGKVLPLRRLLWLFFVVNFLYFGAIDVYPYIVIHQLGFSPSQLAWCLSLGGLGWALVGAGCARWPAGSWKSICARSTMGLGLLCLALIGFIVALFNPTSLVFYMFMASSSVAGVGMGLIYLDLLNALYEEGGRFGDQIADLSTALVVCESVAGALALALGASWISTGFGLMKPQASSSSLFYCFLLLVNVILGFGFLILARRSKATLFDDDADARSMAM